MRGALVLLLAGCSFEHGRVGSGNGDGGNPGDGKMIDAAVIDAPPVDATLTTLRQKTITISQNVAGTHTSFPLWITLTDSDLAARARMDGTDIHFVIDGQDADYQIQSWTKSSGRLDAWVRVPSMAAGTQVLLRYGDVTAAHVPNAANTFMAYTNVWHFEDALTNSTIVDARGANNGTGTSLGTNDSVDGQLGRGIAFSDNNEQIAIANPLSGTTPHTISAWVNQATTSSNDCIIALGNGSNDEARWLHSRFNSAEVAVGLYGNDWVDINHDIIGDGWTLVHWVLEGANRNSRFYVNGQLVAGPYTHATFNTQGQTGLIGNAPGAFGTNMGINASLDEVRIVNVALGAAWIAAEALNQTTPGSSYQLSAEQIP